MEYFEKNHWGLRQAHCHTARVCLLLLIETYTNVDPPVKVDWREVQKTKSHDIFDLAHPLQLYIRHHWVIHVQTQEGHEANLMLALFLKTFLKSPNESSLQYRRWYRQIEIDNHKRERPSTSAFRNISTTDIASEDVAVFVMCRFLFYTVLLDWWEGAEIELRLMNRSGYNLLALASKAGCKQICRNLVKRGMQVNFPTEDSHYGSALVVAVAERETEIVKFLVQEAGADVNMLLQSGDYGSALAAAAAVGGKTDIIKFLVQEAGADVNMLLQSGDYGSALTVAIVGGDTDIVKFLVQVAGADVNMLLQSGDYGSALIAAVAEEETDIVKFLVQEAGADVNQQLRFGRYGSALASAAYWGRKECVEVLIEAGADVNLRLENGPFGSALQASLAEVFQEDLERIDGKERIERARAEVAELLQRHGAM